MALEVVHVSRSDLMGGRFNGFAVRGLMEQRGVHSTHLVFDRRSNDPDSQVIFKHALTRQFIRTASRLEQKKGLHSLYQLQSIGLAANSHFRRANIAHYHIIHDGFFSLAALPVLTRLKPSVWTWHDPWIMTGHCVYPIECERWRIGCGECPDLARPYPVTVDNTRKAFSIKRQMVRGSSVDIVLASQWMLDMARASPMAAGARLHHIPFGVDLERFAPSDPRQARERLGVLPGRVVVAIRGFSSPFKGIEAFAAALEYVKTPLCLISIQDEGAFDRFIGRHQVIALDWTDKDGPVIEAYTAADFFVMPSAAEAFGLMAVEAMACGKPVVVFSGTSLPEVTFAPDVGIAAPMGNVRALANAMQHLIDDAEDRARRGMRARELAERHYSSELHVDRLAALYHDIAGRRVHQKTAEETAGARL